MTREETKKILLHIQALYPNWKPQSDIGFMIDVWNEYTLQYTYKQMLVALKAYLATNTSGFAPSIGQLLDKLNEIEKPEELNEMEAWSLVGRALRNGIYGAEEEFEKLPPAVQSAVGSPSQLRAWAQTDSKSVENVIQSNFMRSYRTVLKREKEMDKLPDDIKSLIDRNINNKKRIESYKTKKIENQRIDKGVCSPMPENVKKRWEEYLRKEIV